MHQDLCNSNFARLRTCTVNGDTPGGGVTAIAKDGTGTYGCITWSYKYTG